MFLDYVEIQVKAGSGGDGRISFHTEKFVPMGGPNGGDGGGGASIIAVADSQLTTLQDFRYKRIYKAPKGQPGGERDRSGKSGKDIYLRVPAGTIIKDLDSGDILYDLDQPGDEVVIVKGGRGGRGNAFFKTSTNQSPRMAQDGEAGEEKRLALELKLLAEVGLVGLPNAGKSTILASCSAARPKIADYPFTTLVPNLGIVSIGDYMSCVMADIPGLIRGAAEGKGLGHQFLKHIQRTRLLVYVIDCNEEDIPKARETLQSELVEFDPSLANRASLTVITKIDTVLESDLKEISEKLPSDYIYISAVAKMGTDEFLQSIGRELDEDRSQRATD